MNHRPPTDAPAPLAAEATPSASETPPAPAGPESNLTSDGPSADAQGVDAADSPADVSEAPAASEGPATHEQPTSDAAAPADQDDAQDDAQGSALAEADLASPPVTPEELALHVEVALMTTDRAIPPAKLADTLGKVGVKAIQQAVQQLNQTYEDTGRSFRIEQVANGLQILTLPRFADVMERLHKTRSAGKLSPAAMETLAIIAYKQPILRAQVEAIRGVASGEVVRSLMERKLVKIVGRSEEIGRPMLYGTTKAFLETFGLASLKDLPKAEDLASGKGL